MTTYRVKQGDCLNSIAYKYNFFWEKIWNHPNNSTLKQTRKDPNALAPGDEIFIPDKELREEPCACGQKHQFCVKGVPAKIKIKLCLNEEPRKNQKYELIIDGTPIKEGTTDAQGFANENIPPDAKKGEIQILDEDGNRESYLFNLGTIDPIDTEEGVAGRLMDLGYYEGDLEEAIKEFQSKYGLEETGTITEALKSKLQEVFGQ